MPQRRPPLWPCRCIRLGFGFCLGLFFGQPRIHFRRFGGMNLMVILVRLRQLLAIEKQPAEPVVGGQLEFVIHLDGFERANLDADLAAHADRNIDVEFRWINLRLANKVRLLVLAFLDVNALGRALFFADLAGHAAQPFLPVLAVIDKEGKIARSLGRGIRSSGYSTVVIRSFETKLPAKFFAVSAKPFSMPSPSM